ncbi:hypothetical protein A9G37_04115 [Gilliamella sp. GillExp13]|nr:hypothetical protein A9G37_04115 [Gilliamella apicola]
MTVKDLNTGNCFDDCYDKLLLAVGASPIIPPFENSQLKNIFTLRNLHDGVAIKQTLSNSNIRNLIVIGAGYIGLEIAESLVALQKNVKLICNSPLK